MISTTEMDAFLQQGLTQYVLARDAVETFEREMRERLLHVFEDKRDWRHFAARRGERGRGKALDSGVWQGATGPAIWASQANENSEHGWIDLGVWWNPPEHRDTVVLYASRWAPGWRLVDIDLADPSAGVECGPVSEPSKKRLFVRLDKLTDLHLLGRRLLDDMDRALAPRVVAKHLS